MSTAKSLFRAAPHMDFAPLHNNGRDTPEIPMQAEPTGAYGVALARFRCGEDGAEVSGSTQDHMLGFVYSPPVPVTVWFCGRRFHHQLGPGNLVITPAGVDSVCKIDGRSDVNLIRVSVECFALARSQLASPGSTLVELPIGRDAKMLRIGRALEDEAAAGHPNGTLYWSSVADALIRHLAENHVSADALPAHGALDVQALERLKAYIDANLAEPLVLESLAAIVGCERFQFARRFRETVGITPHRYVVRRRLKRACEMMKAKAASLAEIALTTGFYDQSHLCGWIRRVYGATPSQLVHG